MKFTKDLQEHLQKHGWSENRKDTTQSKYMTNYPDFVIEFMQEFGGLTIPELFPKLTDRKVIKRNVFDIGAAEGADGITGAYEEVFNKKLYAIGVLEPGSYDISVDENGYVYLIGEYCHCAGKDFHKGIEQIIRSSFGNMLDLDPRNEDEVIWLDYAHHNNREGEVVDLKTYEFKYDF